MPRDINITHSEVLNYARQLRSWGHEMDVTRRRIQAKAKSLESHWSDPQYRQFLDTAVSEARHLEGAIRNFQGMADTLEQMARELERVQQESRRRLQGRGR